MTQPIQRLQIDIGETHLFSMGFRNLIENHLPFLRSHTSTIEKNISPHSGYTWVGDYYGLLLSLDIPHDLLWITLRMNGYTSPGDYDGNNLVVLVPSQAQISKMLTRYTNTASLR